MSKLSGLTAVAIIVITIIFMIPVWADVSGATAAILPPTEKQIFLQPAPASLLPPIQTNDPVLMKPTAGLDATQIAQQLSERLGTKVQAYSKVPGWVSVSVPTGFTTDQVLQEINNDSLAEVASRHARFYMLEVPNDEYAIDADPETDYGQYYLYDVNAPQAWDLQHGSHDTTIAIIDSGMSIYHEDLGTSDGLSGNIWHNTGEIPDNGIDDDGNGFTDDYWGWDFVGQMDGSTTEASDPDTYVSYDDDYPTVWDPDWWNPSGVPSYSDDPAIGNADDDNGDGVPDAGVTHGTMVGGIAGAITNNNLDIAGMSWNCNLMTVRVINPEGWGWDEDAAAAIRYAADQGADVINMSFSFGLREGFGENPPIPDAVIAMIEESIQYAVSKGCIVIGAAGNSGASTGYPGGIDFPADMPETISVGAVDWDRERSYYSNYAATDDVLDIMAPGDVTFTTSVLEMYTWGVFEMLLPGEYTLGEDLLDAPLGGTSFSTPIVSGFAGLLKTRYPGMTYEQFRDFIQLTALDLGDAGYDNYYGYGELDAYEAILYADANIPEPATLALFAIGLAGLAARLRRRKQSLS